MGKSGQPFYIGARTVWRGDEMGTAKNEPSERREFRAAIAQWPLEGIYMQNISTVGYMQRGNQDGYYEGAG